VVGMGWVSVGFECITTSVFKMGKYYYA
jgi:hypothetical protein